MSRRSKRAVTRPCPVCGEPQESARCWGCGGHGWIATRCRHAFPPQEMESERFLRPANPPWSSEGLHCEWCRDFPPR